MTLVDLERLSPVERARLAGVLRRHVFRTTEFVWLYAIQAGEGGPIKIGVTMRPAERLRTLQTANADRLIGRAAWRAMPGEEQALHERFADARLRGEWFRPVPELVEYLLAEGRTFDDWTAAAC